MLWIEHLSSKQGMFGILGISVENLGCNPVVINNLFCFGLLSIISVLAQQWHLAIIDEGIEWMKNRECYETFAKIKAGKRCLVIMSFKARRSN